MGEVKVHAGDFRGSGSFTFGVFSLKTEAHPFVGETIHGSELETVAIATEETVKTVAGTVGWGLVGGALLGPVGLLAGLLGGGRKKKVTFVARFKDGRKLLGTTDNKTFIKLQAAVF